LKTILDYNKHNPLHSRTGQKLDMTKVTNWEEQIGKQRDWIWKGWQIRYTFKRVSPEFQHSDVPLILIHGFGASIHHWRKNIPILSEKHTVYALDLLGFGASRKPFTHYQIQLWSQLVYDFWQTFIRTPVVLVGNSLGSLVSLYTSVTYPEMVKGLVMLNLPDVAQRQAMIPKVIQPLVNTLENLVASPLLIRLLFYIVRQPAIIRSALKTAYVNPSAVTDELVNIIVTPPQDQGAARALIALTQFMNQPPLPPLASSLLSQLQIPTLLIWGKGDRLVSPKLAPILAQQNPHIELLLLDNIGHCPQDENPAQFNHILLEWLSRY
jgi:haloalkane dehalogenase